MTERIEQITKQTDEYFDDLSIEFSRQVWMEKFAELIVQECVNQCEKDMVPDEDVIEGYDEDWNMALKHGVDQIKQHFGVEQ